MYTEVINAELIRVTVNIKPAVSREDAALTLTARPERTVAVDATLRGRLTAIIDTLKADTTLITVTTSALHTTIIETDRERRTVDVISALTAEGAAVIYTGEVGWTISRLLTHQEGDTGVFGADLIGGTV